MMKRIRKYICYTIKELEEFVKVKGSCVTKVYNTMHIGLAPFSLNNLNESILTIIAKKKIGLYDSKLDGIILDVRKIKVLKNTGTIRIDDPTIHIDIAANFYIFQLEIGSVVRGIVKHISVAHNYECVIGVIIHRVFSVSIILENYIKENIHINSEIEIRVKNFDLKCRMPFIEGELISREEEQYDDNEVIEVSDIENKDDQFDEQKNIKTEYFQISNSVISTTNGLKKDVENNLQNETNGEIQENQILSHKKRKAVKIKLETPDSLNSSELSDISVPAKKTKRSHTSTESRLDNAINEILLKNCNKEANEQNNNSKKTKRNNMKDKISNDHNETEYNNSFKNHLIKYETDLDNEYSLRKNSTNLENSCKTNRNYFNNKPNYVKLNVNHKNRESNHFKNKNK